MVRARVANGKALMVLVGAVLLVCGGGGLPAAVASGHAREEVHLVPAVYVFGDSTVDVGNNQYLPGNAPLQLPYGIDFPQSRATGRFSNGYNVADSISRILGFKRSPPAYLSLTPQTSRQIFRGFRGANYASGGSGILDTTGNTLTLTKQVELFAATKSKMTEYAGGKGSAAVDALLSKSLFLISDGGNDMFAFILQNRTAAEAPSFYTDLLSNYTKHVQTLYTLPTDQTPPSRRRASDPPARRHRSMMMAGPYHQPTTLEEVRTLWIGDLQYWADENYLYSCFAHTGEVQSVKLIRNKLSNLPEGYGFIEFISHEAAERVLQAYNGAQMPGTEHTFRLNWASFSSGEKRPDAGPDHSIFVGDLAPDVTDYLLQETFRVNYSSVRGAKVVTDPNTGRSKGYGFVKFADENEKTRAMSEMNGVYCSTRPMRISAAIPKKSAGSQLPYGAAKAVYPAAAYTIPQAQTVMPDSDLTNTTIFIGNLDPNVTEEELRQICAQLGDLIYVKIPVGKGCGFVQYVSRASAEEAVQRLHGTLIGQQVVRLSWGRSPANKQDQSAAWTQQADPNQWNAYYGYGYDPYGYAQDPSYAYGAYAGYSQYPQQVEGATDMAPTAGSHVPGTEQNEVYDPMNLPDVDKLNASYMYVHGSAMLGRHLWLKTSPLSQQA